MRILARQVTLRRRIEGKPAVGDFQIDEAELGKPAEGEVLVRNLWLSLDPYMRLYMTTQPGLHGSVTIGAPMPGGAVGEVIASASDALPVGSQVRSTKHGWRDHYLAPAAELEPVAVQTAQIRRLLSLNGLTGVTAWGGVNGVLGPRAGEAFFINAAAGAVGSIAVQLARLAGATIIACAGSDQKGRWLMDTLGAHHFINHRTQNLASRLAEIAPDGIETAFDNVGGEQLEAVIDAMKPKGRIALCGAISLYDSDNYRRGPRNLFAIIEKHVSLTGFNAGFYFDKAPQIAAEFASLEESGQLIYHEQVVEGLDAMPQAFVDMLSGNAIGKVLVKV